MDAPPPLRYHRRQRSRTRRQQPTPEKQPNEKVSADYWLRRARKDDDGSSHEDERVWVDCYFYKLPLTAKDLRSYGLAAVAQQQADRRCSCPCVRSP
jgi:hypothetical protein